MTMIKYCVVTKDNTVNSDDFSAIKHHLWTDNLQDALDLAKEIKGCIYFHDLTSSIGLYVAAAHGKAIPLDRVWGFTELAKKYL